MTESADYQTIAKAIRVLEEDFLQQPSLDELADRMGMSRFRLQRLFTRWAGVSPKRFLQFLTLEHAKDLLRNSEPVLATAFASGLSGPARLHDLFVTIEGVTPGGFKRQGTALEITYGFQPTPFGVALLAHTQRGLCHLTFLPSGGEAEEEPALRALRADWPGASFMESRGELAQIAQSIFHPAQDSQPRESLSLFLKGTNYQLKVWNALLRVPPGTVTTYGRLAGFMGAPKSARAVGSAVAKNNIAFLIPCHRVIREMGAFGEYRWGAERKKAILGWEGAQKAS